MLGTGLLHVISFNQNIFYLLNNSIMVSHSSMWFKWNGLTGGWCGLCGAQRGRRRSGEGRQIRPGHPGPVWGYLGDCSLSWWALRLWTAINTIPAPVSLLDFIPWTLQRQFSLTGFFFLCDQMVKKKKDFYIHKTCEKHLFTSMLPVISLLWYRSYLQHFLYTVKCRLLRIIFIFPGVKWNKTIL